MMAVRAGPARDNAALKLLQFSAFLVVRDQALYGKFRIEDLLMFALLLHLTFRL